MKEVITAIITMRILVQFVSQAVGIIAWRYLQPKEERPYKMPLFPLPAIISIAIWLFILFSSELIYIWFALGIIGVGLLLYKLKSAIKH